MLTTEETAALTKAANAAQAYRAGILARPIRATQSYAQLMARFGGELAQKGVPPDRIIEELVQNAEHGLLTQTHPRMLGWVTGASHPAGVAADWLTSAWGQNAPSSEVTPAAAVAEEVAGEWMKDLLGLPKEAGFGFTTGATMANTIAMAAARNALLLREGWDVEAKGLYGAPEVHVVLGQEAHSTIFMGLRLLGFGAKRVIKVVANSDGQMDARALQDTLEPLSGPILLIAQAGHINSGAFDPFAEITTIAKTKNAWVHVDGAFGLWAQASKTQAHLAKGVNGCDSWVVDGHKWLQTPYDGGFVFVRDKAALERAMSVTASYLPEQVSRDPGANTPELSRRARGFAVWAVLRAFGRDGVAEMVARHCAIAKGIADDLDAVEGLRIMNKVVLNQVALCCDTGGAVEQDNKLTEALLQQLQAGNICFPSGAVWQGRSIIRMSVSSKNAQLDDVGIIAGNVKEIWQNIRGTV